METLLNVLMNAPPIWRQRTGYVDVNTKNVVRSVVIATKYVALIKLVLVAQKELLYHPIIVIYVKMILVNI